jgi:hypothetical protein
VDRPAPETCEALRPPRWAPTSGAPDPHGDLRVVGLQYKQDVDNVTSYDSFRSAAALTGAAAADRARRGAPSG